jgi:hypothetical protein
MASKSKLGVRAAIIPSKKAWKEVIDAPGAFGSSAVFFYR